MDEEAILFSSPREPRAWLEEHHATEPELWVRYLAQGRMTPAGEAAFAARREADSNAYSYERRHEAAFDAEQEATSRDNASAREWSDPQSPSDRSPATFWVVSAKRPGARARRLATLIECSGDRRRISAALLVARRPNLARGFCSDTRTTRRLAAARRRAAARSRLRPWTSSRR